MKTTMKIMPKLIGVAVLALSSQSAIAGGTPSNTPVDNTATVAYSVGGTTQTVIESSEGGNTTPGVGNGEATTFLVDKKVDLLVTPPTDLTVNPEATAQNLTFVVTNEGNDPEDFAFTLSDIAGGDFDPDSCSVAPATVTALAADATTNVVVSCDIPALGATDNGGTAGAGTVANTNTALVDLLAEVTGVTATTGVDDPAAVDTVFADGTGTTTDGSDRNAQHSAAASYVVSSAGLIVTKTEAVTNMAFDLDDDGATGGAGTNAAADEADASGNLYHIPGSTVTYTITVSNAAGAATATGINIGDTVPATMVVVGTPTITGGTSTTASAAGNVVSTTPFDLAAGETATLTIVARIL